MSVNIALGIGSNMGDCAALIVCAVQELKEAGLKRTRLSSLYKTAPVDCVPGTPDFTNAALVGEWNGTAEQLLGCCHDIEVRLGRPEEHNSDEARTIDLDLLLFGQEIIRNDRLTIPHPQMTKRLFVLIPLAEIASDWEIPGIADNVGTQCEKIKRKQGIAGFRIIDSSET